jgi:soluble P-type ATPase
MLQIPISGASDLTLAHLVCDVNGTLAVDGQVSAPVRERLRLVAEHLQVHLVSADTYGTLNQLIEEFRQAGVSIQMERVTRGEDKAAYVRALGPEQVVALGNGANDVQMFQLARLSIAVCGVEGLARGALQAATLVAPGPEVALDLLLHPHRLTATLRP